MASGDELKNLEFWNREMLLPNRVTGAKMHYFAGFNQNWSTGYGDITSLQYFTMVATHCIGFLKSLNFIGWWNPEVKMHHLAKFCYNRSHVIIAFRFFKIASATILDFKSCKILSALVVRRAKMHHRAKYHRNRSSGFWDITIFRFFKMAAVRHLVCVWGIFGPPT